MAIDATRNVARPCGAVSAVAVTPPVARKRVRSVVAQRSATEPTTKTVAIGVVATSAYQGVAPATSGRTSDHRVVVVSAMGVRVHIEAAILTTAPADVCVTSSIKVVLNNVDVPVVQVHLEAAMVIDAAHQAGEAAMAVQDDVPLIYPAIHRPNKVGDMV